MNTETIKQGSNEDSRVRKEPLSFDDLRKLLDSDDKIVKNQLHLFMWRLKESYGAEFPFKCQPCFEEKELSGPTVQSVWKLTFPTRDDLTIINCTDFDLSVGDTTLSSGMEKLLSVGTVLNVINGKHKTDSK